jgi:hypothetical protein
LLLECLAGISGKIELVYKFFFMKVVPTSAAVAQWESTPGSFCDGTKETGEAEVS